MSKKRDNAGEGQSSRAAKMLSLQNILQTDDYYSRSNMTKNQLLIWMEQKLHPATSLYNMASLFTFSGNVEVEHFRIAFQVLIDQSDSLRTVIEEIDGVPVQKVLAQLPYVLELIDLSAQEHPERIAYTLLKKRCLRPFHLDQITFDSVLIKCAADSFLWYFCQHHTMVDAWANTLLYRRLAEFYASSIQETLHVAQLSSPQFQAYVPVERAYRNSPQYLLDKEYWEKKLIREEEVLKYYGRASPTRISPARRILYDLGVERTQSIKALAQKNVSLALTLDMSLSILFTALFFAYLRRISGSEHLAIGVPFHNRLSEKFKQTSGMLMEVCPLFVDVTAETTFASLLKELSSEIISSLRHYKYATGNTYQHKIYDAMVNYHHMSIPPLAGLPTRCEWLLADAINVSLSLQVYNFAEAESILLGFDFNCDIFTEEKQHAALYHFLRVFDALLDSPEHYIDQLELLSEQERATFLMRSQQEKIEHPQHYSLAGLFARHVASQPDHPAVIAETQTFTYKQVNERANQFAHYLQQKNVGLETRVAVCMKRTPEMIIGLLGILKVGGTYVPLDPDYPQERLAFMLENAQVRVLLVQRQYLSRFPVVKGIVYLPAEDALEESIQQSNEDCFVTIPTASVAYVIYTSGSTGKPKGVAITHAGIVNNLIDLQQRFRVDSHDRVLNLSSLSFDMSVYEIFGILGVGGTVILPLSDRLRDPQHWVELINLHKITIWNSAPSLLNMFVEYLEQHKQDRPSSLRLALLGGDWVPLDLPDRLRSLVNTIEVISLGGATEASIHSTIYPIQAIDPSWSSIPYGVPMLNQYAYILDEYAKPSLAGLPGELYLGGMGLARGYLNQPDVTAERFLPDPFCTDPGARMYKTGDLVRAFPDGTIELLGRIDHQVKIRGFRIELGEIETTLKLHPAIRDAVVLAKKDAANEQSLVAYLVLEAGLSLTRADVRNSLKRSLLHYMLPTAIVFLEALPLTANGKIDRLNLPLPDYTSMLSADTFVAPRTPLEQLLVSVWTSGLASSHIGVYDDFFELGGHSLNATRVVSLLSDIFTIDLPLSVLFEKTTIASLAEYISLHCHDHNIDAIEIAEFVLQISTSKQDETAQMAMQMKEAP